MTTPQEPKSATDTQSVVFHYIKSNYFRVVHVDGAWGGITPRGLIQASFYSERQAIPREMTYVLTPEGKLGKELREVRVAKDGVVRELEVEVIFNLDSARAFRSWLVEKIGDLEKQMKVGEPPK